MTLISNQVIFITGATDGLGKALALRLAEMGASLILHGRNSEKGQNLLEEIKQVTGNTKLVYYNADFSGLTEVRELADKILSSHQQLDMLINNAGIGGGADDARREISRDGFELRFAVNYLAPFLLTHQVLPLLMKSEPSRIINIASGAQDALDFTDLMLEKNYSGKRAYAQSKLALVMFSFSLAEKLKNHAICTTSLHPATLMNTKMVIESGLEPHTVISEGVQNVLKVAVPAETANCCGQYFSGGNPGYADPQAYEDETREKLYQLSTELVDL